MQGTQGFSQKISAHSVQLKVEIEDGREASLKAIVSYNYSICINITLSSC